jgi:hypothetical protein
LGYPPLRELEPRGCSHPGASRATCCPTDATELADATALLWLTGPTIGARDARLEGKAPPFSMQTTALEPLLPRTVTPPFRLRQGTTPKKPRPWEMRLRARGRETHRSS